MIVRVYHSEYGCDTGCCGHRIELVPYEKYFKERFEFEHPSYLADKSSYKEWALALAKKVVEENWPECFDSIDWENIQYDEVTNDC